MHSVKDVNQDDWIGNDIKVYLDRDKSLTFNPGIENRTSDSLQTLVDGNGHYLNRVEHPESEINMGNNNDFFVHRS